MYIMAMSYFDSSNNLDALHVFDKITKPDSFAENSLLETIRLVKNTCLSRKNAINKT